MNTGSLSFTWEKTFKSNRIICPLKVACVTGGKGEFGRARRVPFSPRSLRARISSSPSPSNACHAGEIQGDCRVRFT